MSWKNKGQWHIDHIIPLSAFNYEKPGDTDFKKAWSLKNLQPLWMADNNRKYDKLDQPFQPSFIF
jgi:5-methylcytosine-specific restriction endonuclease McrA